MPDCVFCKVISKEIPSKKEYEDGLCIVFHDIHPRTETHLLVVPKKHLATMKDVTLEDEAMLGHLLKVAADIAKKFQLDAYRLLISTGKEAGQEIFHVHLHLMSPI